MKKPRTPTLAIFALLFAACSGSDPLGDGPNHTAGGDADSDGDSDSDSDTDSDADGDADSDGDAGLITDSTAYCAAMAAALEQAMNNCAVCNNTVSIDKVVRVNTLQSDCLEQFRDPYVGHDWQMKNECLRLRQEVYGACQWPYHDPDGPEDACSADSTFGLLAEGERCESDQECADGMACDRGDLKCELLHQAGAACVMGDVCVDGYHCNGGECEVNHAEGGYCSNDTYCQRGLFCTGTVCTRYEYPDGSFCQSDDQCASGDCAYSTCVRGAQPICG